VLNEFIEAGDNNNIPTIDWDLIDVCQYRCTYCYNDTLINKEEYKKGLHQQAWKLVLKKLNSLNFDFNLNIHGGEPTLHPELFTIIEELESIPHCLSVVISSNITAEDAVYLQLDKPKSKVSLHLSYHPEYHRKIFNKVIRIINQIKNIKVWVGVVLYPKAEYYDQMIEFLELMKNTNIKMHVSLPNKTNDWQETVDPNYYKLFGSYIEESKIDYSYRHVKTTGEVVYVPEYTMMRSDFNYRGWKCQALSYTVGVDGTIVNKCTKQRMPLAIKEEDIKKFVTCPQADLCYCSEMFNYKKFKSHA
jgi:MoaA/NifB/PqqE/SkfB family radical SAM enzyme